MLQNEVLSEVYFSTDFAAVIDVLFHAFRKSTATKKFSNFRTEFETGWSELEGSKLEGYCLLEQMGMTTTNFH